MAGKNTHWLPPGKNCGLCGEKSCQSFLQRVALGEKGYETCPYYGGSAEQTYAECLECCYSGYDLLDNPYDFVLTPLPGEVSARKIVLPFRSDSVEKLNIASGDIVLGRPMGAGCPIPHALRVIKAEPVTGLLYTWVVGPKYSRDCAVKDVAAYHMIGFEGLITDVRVEPQIGCRATFLPGLCMMNLNHTGLVNMILQKKEGLHVRLEDIRILAGKK